MGVKYFTDQGPDGCSLGKSTSDLVSLYGVTPITQRTSASQALVATTAIAALDTTLPTSTAPYGYSSTVAAAILSTVNTLSVRAAALTVLANEIQASLVVLGAIKGS
jgi:hypothetical protein